MMGCVDNSIRGFTLSVRARGWCIKPRILKDWTTHTGDTPVCGVSPRPAPASQHNTTKPLPTRHGLLPYGVRHS